VGHRHSVADLQCQARVGHKRENFNASYYSAYCSAATVLNGLFSKISGWAVAHTAHPLDQPLPSLHALIEDSTDEFHMASSGEASSGLPASRRHGTGAPPAPIATIPWPEDTLCTQTMTMVLPQTLSPRSDTGLPLER
jgi:hypothetical protein